MNADDRELHDQHTAFAAGLLDVIRVLVGHLATGAPMSPEALRDRLIALLPQRESCLGRIPIERIIEDLDQITAVRDGARFNKTLAIAQAAGRSGSDRSTTSH